MRRLGWLLLSLLAAGLSLSTPAVGRVRAGDAAATHAYLAATVALDRTEGNELAGLSAIGALAAQVQAECPGVLAHAPQHAPKGEFINESAFDIAGELSEDAYGAEAPPYHLPLMRFAETVQRLRWSNRTLTKNLRLLALDAAERSAIAPPTLCADMKFWVASNYKAVSADTIDFLHQLEAASPLPVREAIESEPRRFAVGSPDAEALVLDVLKPYENHADRLLARKARPYEPTSVWNRRVSEAVVKVFAAAGTTTRWLSIGWSEPPPG